MNALVLMCLCVVGVALGAPSEGRALPAVEHTHEVDERGQYTLRYVTAEGTIVEERGRLTPSNDGLGEVLLHEGEFSFVGDNGVRYVTKYKTTVPGAYQPEGEHLPKPVEPEPLPEALKVNPTA